MKPSPEQQCLLADVLGAGVDAGFRETLLGETLRLARRRRQWRAARKGFAALAALTLAATGAWWVNQPKAVNPHNEVARGGDAPVAETSVCGLNLVSTTPGPVVRTQPLRSEEIVSTRPMASGQLIASAATAPVVTTVFGGYREIGDDELLALAAPRVAALVRRGPHEAELIFVQPDSPAAEP